MNPFKSIAEKANKFSLRPNKTKELVTHNSIGGYSWLCLDIGTENMKARFVNTGLSYDEPSYIAEDYEKNRVYFGQEAKLLVDKTNENIVVKRPIRDGNIADPAALERIIEKIFNLFKINMVDKKQLIVIMATPSEINPVQRSALEGLVERLGAQRGFIEEEAKMAALGSGQDIFGTAIMCIDMGGGSTDIAVISNDSILYSTSTNCAGDFITEKIQEYIAVNKNVRIGTKEAEDLKKAISALLPAEDEQAYKVSGLLIPKEGAEPGQILSISKTVYITPEEIRTHVLQKQFNEHIIPAIRKVLRNAGAIALGAISDLKKHGKGITICGGGAYIKNIHKFIQEELVKDYKLQEFDENGNILVDEWYEGDRFEVRCSQNPLYDVINGCVKYRDEIYYEIQRENQIDIFLNKKRIKRKDVPKIKIGK